MKKPRVRKGRGVYKLLKDVYTHFEEIDIRDIDGLKGFNAGILWGDILYVAPEIAESFEDGDTIEMTFNTLKVFIDRSKAEVEDWDQLDQHITDLKSYLVSLEIRES